MIVGCLKEIKNNENRVALTPSGAEKLVSESHKVLVERDAGNGSAFAMLSILRQALKLFLRHKRLLKNQSLFLKSRSRLKKNTVSFTKTSYCSLIFTFLQTRS